MISLFGCSCLAAQSAVAAKTPAVALVDSADAAQWQTWLHESGWQVLAPSGAAESNIDQRVQALARTVEQAIQSGGVDPERVYLAGRGDAAAAVFYAISRVPDLWAAGVALGGSPKPAIDTNRLFAANFTNTPVLWLTEGDEQELAQKLKTAGMNLEWRAAANGASAATVLQWLAGHKREEFPATIDCETNSPTFARCYWIQLAKFDAGERNDVLPTTRVAGTAAAALDLGAFGFRLGDPGPGVLISNLPANYKGPLKPGDRIVALDGREIPDAHRYAELMEKATEARAAVATVLRGKDRIRVETRILVPKPEAVVSARVQAQYLPADKTIQIVSRTVTEMRVTVAPQWVPSSLFWNGLSLENLQAPGCYALTVEKELLHAAPCR